MVAQEAVESQRFFDGDILVFVFDEDGIAFAEQLGDAVGVGISAGVTNGNLVIAMLAKRVIGRIAWTEDCARGLAQKLNQIWSCVGMRP